MSRAREQDTLLDDNDSRIPLQDRAGEPPKDDKFDFKEFLTTHGLLLFYVVMAILVGTANRVTFRLMQYSMMNYGYFISQITTFIYLPVNFLVVMIKLLFTDHITREMLEFPKWKFIVMGFFDSLQGLLIVVGGLYVPGIMQNLLLQGSVPVTMFFSLLMLRSSGDVISRVARNILYMKRIQFTEEYAGDDAVEQAQADKTSVCRLTVNGKDMGNIPAILANEQPPNPELEWFGPSCVRACTPAKRTLHSGSGSIQGGLEVDDVTLFGGSTPADLMGAKVVLTTDAHTWGAHFRNYYSIAQYLGAAVIMGGLVVSVWPSLVNVTTASSTIFWELIFFSSTIPIAISGVYKEIAFKSVEDMDVWYLNGYVAVYQFLLGLTYAPLAAVMTDLQISDIPSNIWQGMQCWLLGTNFITRDNGYACSVALNCGTGNMPQCCDSCDGSIHTISSLPALWGVCLYMVANIAYNVFLVLVIKHGSAALMYATSTVVLPLGSIAFTIPLFLGAHADNFNAYTGIGLGVVLFGLIIYRFGDLLLRRYWAKRREEMKKQKAGHQQRAEPTFQ